MCANESVVADTPEPHPYQSCIDREMGDLLLQGKLETHLSMEQALNQAYQFCDKTLNFHEKNIGDHLSDQQFFSFKTYFDAYEWAALLSLLVLASLFVAQKVTAFSKPIGYSLLFLLLAGAAIVLLFLTGFLRLSDQGELNFLIQQNYVSTDELLQIIDSDLRKITYPATAFALVLTSGYLFQRYRYRCRHCSSWQTKIISREVSEYGSTIFISCRLCGQKSEAHTLNTPGRR